MRHVVLAASVLLLFGLSLGHASAVSSPGSGPSISFRTQTVRYNDLTPAAQQVLADLSPLEIGLALATPRPTPTTAQTAALAAGPSGYDSVCFKLANLNLACLSALASGSTAPSSMCSPAPGPGSVCFRFQADADLESLADASNTVKRYGDHVNDTCITTPQQTTSPNGCEGCYLGSSLAIGYTHCGTVMYVGTVAHAPGTMCIHVHAVADTQWVSGMTTAVLDGGPDC